MIRFHDLLFSSFFSLSGNAIDYIEQKFEVCS